MKVSFQFYTDERQYVQIKKVAKELDQSQSSLIRDALETYFYVLKENGDIESI